MKLVSIVFSFRNEEKNIKELINRVDAAFKKVKNELLANKTLIRPINAK